MGIGGAGGLTLKSLEGAYWGWKAFRRLVDRKIEEQRAMHLKIGEFARLGMVAVSALRYYDEVGLLKPAGVDRWTGYRYYTPEQLPALYRILALKDLGLSLEQIRVLLGETLPAAQIRGM